MQAVVEHRAGDACGRCKRGALAWHRRRTAGGETMLTLACSHCPAVYERVPDGDLVVSAVFVPIPDGGE